MFYMKSLDQIIFCAIFSVSKIYKKKISFKEIVEAYDKIENINKDISKVRILNFTNRELVNEGTLTIIEFYNQYFLKEMGLYLKHKIRTFPHC